MLQDLLSAEIQNTQFADLLVCDCETDKMVGIKGWKWVTPSGQQSNDGSDWAPGLLWMGRPAGS